MPPETELNHANAANQQGVVGREMKVTEAYVRMVASEVLRSEVRRR